MVDHCFCFFSCHNGTVVYLLCSRKQSNLSSGLRQVITDELIKFIRLSASNDSTISHACTHHISACNSTEFVRRHTHTCISESEGDLLFQNLKNFLQRLTLLHGRSDEHGLDDEDRQQRHLFHYLKQTPTRKSIWTEQLQFSVAGVHICADNPD